MERNPILQERNFLLNGTWFCIDKQKKKKKERLYHFFSILIEIALLCQKKDSYTDSVYSKDTLGTTIEDLTKMKSQWISIYWSYLSQNRSPFLLYMNMWSSACLEARENVLLLILLPVFDTGSFIANLYLPYLLDELRGWLFVSTGLASSSGIGKKPRPNDYFTKSRQGIPLITGRFDPLAQLDSFSRSFSYY